MAITQAEQERQKRLGLTSFYKLPVGARFVFQDPQAASPSYNERYGPFTKTAPGTYSCRDGTVMPHTDGSYVVKELQ